MSTSADSLSIILRYINDSREQKMYKELVPTQEVEIIGVIGLNFFLAMALMNIKRLHEALDYATPQEVETEYYLTKPINTGP